MKMSSYRRNRPDLNGPVHLNTLTAPQSSPPRFFNSYGDFDRFGRRKPLRRRGRRSHSSIKDVADIESGRDDISDNDADELAAAAEKPWDPLPLSRRILIADGADQKILKLSSLRKKRRHSNDEDELADGKNGKPCGRPGKRLLVRSPMDDSPIVSQEGGILQEVPTNSANAPAKAVGFRVAAAVCQKDYLYLDSQRAGEEEEACSLVPVQVRNESGVAHDELRVLRADGRKVEKHHHWLKITPKIISLSWNMDCEIIRIRQPAEENDRIGCLMVLKFDTARTASSVMSWVEKASGFVSVKVSSEDRTKLEQTYKKTLAEITQAVEKKQFHAPKETRVVEPWQSDIPKQPAASPIPAAPLPAPPPAPAPAALPLPAVAVLLTALAARSLPTAPALPAMPALQATPDLPETPTLRLHARDQVPLKDQMRLSKQDSGVQPFTTPSNQSPAVHPGQPPMASSSQLSVASSGQLSVASSGQPFVASSDQPSAEPRSLRSRPSDKAKDKPLRWSAGNTEWANEWRTPLSYNRTTVEIDDVPRLDEGECLNDNLIGFGLQYLYDNIGSRNQDLSKRIYVHNTFFFTKLKSGKARQINYDGVKSWTSRVDLFSYDYIVVPVNENFHWWLAIICNPGKLDPDLCEGPGAACSPDLEFTDGVKDNSLSISHEAATAELSQLSIGDVDEAGRGTLRGRHQLADKMYMDICDETPSSQPRKKPLGRPPTKSSLDDFRVITLDSLGRPHATGITALKNYMVQELKHKKQKEARPTPALVGTKAVNIPQQDNLSDCGIYLLGYMQVFLQNPDVFVRTLLRKEQPAWKIDARRLRDYWRDIVFIQQKQHQEKVEEADTKKKRAKPASGTKSIEKAPYFVPIIDLTEGIKTIEPPFDYPASPLTLETAYSIDPSPPQVMRETLTRPGNRGPAPDLNTMIDLTEEETLMPDEAYHFAGGDLELPPGVV